MSINVTVHGNPISIRRGKMVALDPQEELERRRRIRLQQVRQQSKEIAEEVRNKVRKERDKQFTKAEKDGEKDLKRWQARKLLSLQQQYHDCLQNVGVAHKNAEKSIEVDKVHNEITECNKNLAEIRGKNATTLQKEETKKRKQKEVKAVENKKQVRKIENARSALVARINKDKAKSSPFKKRKRRKKLSTEITINGTVLSNKSDSDHEQHLSEFDDLSILAEMSSSDLSNKEFPLEDSCNTIITVNSDSSKDNNISTEWLCPPKTCTDKPSIVNNRYDSEEILNLHSCKSNCSDTDLKKAEDVYCNNCCSCGIPKETPADIKELINQHKPFPEFPKETRISDRIKHRSLPQEKFNIENFKICDIRNCETEKQVCRAENLCSFHKNYVNRCTDTHKECQSAEYKCDCNLCKGKQYEKTVVCNNKNNNNDERRFSTCPLSPMHYRERDRRTSPNARKGSPVHHFNEVDCEKKYQENVVRKRSPVHRCEIYNCCQEETNKDRKRSPIRRCEELNCCNKKAQEAVQHRECKSVYHQRDEEDTRYKEKEWKIRSPVRSFEKTSPRTRAEVKDKHKDRYRKKSPITPPQSPRKYQEDLKLRNYNKHNSSVSPTTVSSYRNKSPVKQGKTLKKDCGVQTRPESLQAEKVTKSRISSMKRREKSPTKDVGVGTRSKISVKENRIPFVPTVSIREDTTKQSYVEDGSHSVNYFDRFNHFSKEYVQPRLVQKISKDSLHVHPPTDETEREYNELIERRDEEAKMRGNRALNRSKIHRDYQKLLEELPILQRQERLASMRTHNPALHMSDDRFRENERKKQNKIEYAFEKFYNMSKSLDSAPLITCKGVPKSPPSSTCRKPFKALDVTESPPMLNVGLWSEFESAPVSDQTKIPPDESDGTSVSTSQEKNLQQEHEHSIEKLLERIEKQKELLRQEMSDLSSTSNLRNVLSTNPTECTKKQQTNLSKKLMEAIGERDLIEMIRKSVPPKILVHASTSPLVSISGKKSPDVSISCKRAANTSSSDTSMELSSRKSKKTNKSRKRQKVIREEGTQTSPIVCKGSKRVRSPRLAREEATQTSIKSEDKKVIKHTSLKEKCIQARKSPKEKTNLMEQKVTSPGSPLISEADKLCEIIIKMRENTDVKVSKSISGADNKICSQEKSETVMLHASKSQVKPDSKIIVQIKEPENVSKTSAAMRKAFLEMSTSTSYNSPPNVKKKVSGVCQTNEERTAYKDLLNYKPQQTNIDQLVRIEDGDTKQINHRLVKYIQKLLSMSRQSIDDLTVSSASNVSTPAESIMNSSKNAALEQLHNVMNHFNLTLSDLKKYFASSSSEGSNLSLELSQRMTQTSEYQLKKNDLIPTEEDNEKENRCAKSVSDFQVQGHSRRVVGMLPQQPPEKQADRQFYIQPNVKQSNIQIPLQHQYDESGRSYTQVRSTRPYCQSEGQQTSQQQLRVCDYTQTPQGVYQHQRPVTPPQIYQENRATSPSCGRVGSNTSERTRREVPPWSYQVQPGFVTTSTRDETDKNRTRSRSPSCRKVVDQNPPSKSPQQLQKVYVRMVPPCEDGKKTRFQKSSQSLSPSRANSRAPVYHSTSPHMRSAQCTSPHPRSASPHSPHRHLTSPQMRSPTPHLRPSSPQRRPTSSQSHSPTPHPSSPQFRPCSPQNHLSSPQRCPNSPQFRRSSPQGRTGSPQLHPSSPQFRPASPQVCPSSPQAQIQSQFRPGSPHVCHASTSPHFSGPSSLKVYSTASRVCAAPQVCTTRPQSYPLTRLTYPEGTHPAVESNTQAVTGFDSQPREIPSGGTVALIPKLVQGKSLDWIPAEQEANFNRFVEEKLGISLEEFAQLSYPEMVEKYMQLTENCCQRISSLTTMIENIRLEKLRLTSPSPNDDPFSVSLTSYLELPGQQETTRNPSDTSYQKLISECIEQASSTESSVSQETMDQYLLAVDTMNRKKAARVNEDSVEEPPVSSEGTKLHCSTQETFVPMLQGIPKYNGEQLPPNEDTPAAYMLAITQHLNNNKKNRPPPSILRTAMRTNLAVIPHELSTIIEVETIASSRNTSTRPQTPEDKHASKTSLKSHNKPAKSDDENIQKSTSSDDYITISPERTISHDLSGHSLSPKSATSRNRVELLRKKSSDNNIQIKNEQGKIKFDMNRKKSESPRMTDAGKLHSPKKRVVVVASSSSNNNNNNNSKTSEKPILKMSGVKFLSDSSSSDQTPVQIELENVLRSLGMEWALTTLKKTKEALQYSSSSSSFDITNPQQMQVHSSTSGSDISLKEILGKHILCKFSTSTPSSDKEISEVISEISHNVRELQDVSDIAVVGGTESRSKSQQKTSTPIQNSGTSSSKSQQTNLFTGDSEISSVRFNSDEQMFLSIPNCTLNTTNITLDKSKK